MLHGNRSAVFYISSLQKVLAYKNFLFSKAWKFHETNLNDMTRVHASTCINITHFIFYYILHSVSLSYDKIAVKSIKSPDVSPTSTRARSRRVIGRSINLPSRRYGRKNLGRRVASSPVLSRGRWFSGKEHGDREDRLWVLLQEWNLVYVSGAPCFDGVK